MTLNTACLCEESRLGRVFKGETTKQSHFMEKEIATRPSKVDPVR